MAATHADLRLWTDDTVGDDTHADDEPRNSSEQLFLNEAFRAPPRDFAARPFTPPWFEQIERQRYQRQGYWIPKLLEFGRHSGEKILGLGAGMGTDWVQYAKRGAHVIACCPMKEQLETMRRHFESRGQSGHFVHAPHSALPLDASSIDVVCLQGSMDELNRPGAVIDELYRVLRPGGKVIVVSPAKYDAAFWRDSFFPWRRAFRARREMRSHEATGRGLRRAFDRFVEHRIYKRHLRRANLPPIWRFYPLPLMERLVGQMMIMKAFKPLSSAHTVTQLAA